MKRGNKSAQKHADNQPELTTATGAPSNGAQEGKGAKAGKGAQGYRSLAKVGTTQALVVILLTVAAAGLWFSLSYQPDQRLAADQKEQEKAGLAASYIEQQLSSSRSLVAGIATQPAIVSIAELAPEGGEVITGQLGRLPHLQKAFVFGAGDVPRSPAENSGLNFVILDLARKALAGEGSIVGPDAYLEAGRTFVQMAAPVTAADGSRVGVLVMVYDAQLVAQPLAALSNNLGTSAQLVQTSSGGSRIVAGELVGNGETLTRPLAGTSWTLQLRNAATGGGLPLIPLLLIVIPGLLAAAVVAVMAGSAGKSQRSDADKLLGWARKVTGGERARLPDLTWDVTGQIGEHLHTMIRADAMAQAKAAMTASAPKRPAADEASEFDEDAPLFDSGSDALDLLDGDDDILGAGAPDVEEVPPLEVAIDPSIFRAYDIRGVVGRNLTPEVARVIGQAIGSEAQQRGQSELCVGYDGRHSSPELAESLMQGLLSSGCSVIDIGAVPTPVLYFATHHLETAAGVMVTGSHNPADYNGFKIVLEGAALAEDAIQRLYRRIDTGDLNRGQGERSERDVRREYLDRIVDDIAVAAPLKVVVDAGNGIAGELAPMLIEELGCEAVPLYCDVDGSFPNHHPDPGNPTNLTDLIARVQEEGADLGIAFDGDGDRIGVVTNEGQIIWPDRLLMLFAKDVVSRNPGADVIFDVKSSRNLASVISQAGGRPVMWKTGHSLMKAKMAETGALLAGEMSGHIFFSERWYGFDDGLYVAARLLEILGLEDSPTAEIFGQLPDSISTPEINIATTDEEKFGIIETLEKQGDFAGGNLTTIDGLRVDYSDGWGLCRASNTSPMLTLRFEAQSDEELERIQSIFREQLAKAAPTLAVLF